MIVQRGIPPRPDEAGVDKVLIEMTKEEAEQLHAALQSNVNRGWVEMERGKLICWACLGVQGELAQEMGRAGVKIRCASEGVKDGS